MSKSNKDINLNDEENKSTTEEGDSEQKVELTMLKKSLKFLRKNF